MFPDEISYKIETSLSAPGVSVAVYRFCQPEPFERLFEAPSHTLSMSLTPQVYYSQAAFISAGKEPESWSEFGDVTFAPRGSLMMVRAPGGIESYRGLYCIFDDEKFAQTTGLGDFWSDQQLAAGLDIQSPAIKRDLYRILKEVSEASYRCESMVEAVAQAVMVELARYMRRSPSASTTASRVALARWQMRRITEYVEGMIDSSPTIDELAHVCEIGRRQLTRAFKATTGRTIGEYVAEVRMTKAKSLLTETSLSQKEIAFRLGFSGPSSFCATFGKTVGITPKQFRSDNK